MLVIDRDLKSPFEIPLLITVRRKKKKNLIYDSR